MTTTTELTSARSGSAIPPAPDHRGSPLPTSAMIAARFLELRKRRGLMVTLFTVTIGLPTIFLTIRIVLHLVAPRTYGPAGGYDAFIALTVGVLYVFGFIVAATLGVSAGSLDLSEGMFRHQVITGRSRIALYLARIPAGLAIIMPLVAIGFTIVCTVSVFAAPPLLNYNGAMVPPGLSQAALENWAGANTTTVICNFPSRPVVLGVGCLPGPNSDNVKAIAVTPSNPGQGSQGPGFKSTQGPGNFTVLGDATPAQAKAAAIQIARDDYKNYRTFFTKPPLSLMVKALLWIELEAAIGLIVGLGLGSLIGQRTVAVILMILLELILTPVLLRAQIPHLINLQRGVIGVAMAHLEPGHLPVPMGGSGRDYQVQESTRTAVLVVLGWLVGWTGLGAWRMSKREA